MKMLEKIKNIKLSTTVRRMAQGTLFLGLAVLTLTAVTFKQHAVVKGLNIQMISGKSEHLIDRIYLKEIIAKQFGSDLVSVPVEFIDINSIEALYRSNAYVKSAEVFIDKNGILKILIDERFPLMRVLDGSTSYYLDEDGVKVPLSDRYTARLPIIHLNGGSDSYLTEKRKKDLVHLIQTINKDDFARPLVDQIEVQANNEYQFLPLLGKEKIKIGTTKDLTDKLSRIRLFYKKKLAKGHWNQCTYIDVRFKGQIICDNNKT